MTDDARKLFPIMSLSELIKEQQSTYYLEGTQYKNNDNIQSTLVSTYSVKSLEWKAAFK